MATETTNRKAAEAEAKAEAETVEAGNKATEKANEGRAKASGRDKEEAAAPFPNSVVLTEKHLPSVEDANLLAAPVDEAGWTVQSVLDEDAEVVVRREEVPGYYVRPEELPTREGLEALGVDPLTYLAGVPVSDVK